MICFENCIIYRKSDGLFVDLFFRENVRLTTLLKANARNSKSMTKGPHSTAAIILILATKKMWKTTKQQTIYDLKSTLF